MFVTETEVQGVLVYPASNFVISSDGREYL